MNKDYVLPSYHSYNAIQFFVHSNFRRYNVIQTIAVNYIVTKIFREMFQEM